MSAIEQMLKRKASMEESATLGGGTVAHQVKPDQSGLANPQDTVKKSTEASSKPSTKRVINKSHKASKASKASKATKPSKKANKAGKTGKADKPPARVLIETKKLLEKTKLKTGGLQRAKSSAADSQRGIPMDEEEDPVEELNALRSVRDLFSSSGRG